MSASSVPSGEMHDSPHSLQDLVEFEGSPEVLLAALAGQIRSSLRARRAAVLGLDGHQVRLVACDPSIDASVVDSDPPAWLQHISRGVRENDLSAGPVTLEGFDDVSAVPVRVMLATLHAQEPTLVAAAVISVDVDIQACSAMMQLFPVIVSQAIRRGEIALHRERSDALSDCMELLLRVMSHRRFAGAAMALCNEVAGQFHAERVSLGQLRGRYVRAMAMSHTEKLVRQSDLVGDIELAMEECIDQDIEVYTPSHPGDSFVDRATRQLSARHGPAAVCSFPLRVDGSPVGVLTVERRCDLPLTIVEAGRVRVVCDLCAASLYELGRHDRWIGARIASGARRVGAAIVGPRHTWAKLLSVSLSAFLAFSLLAKGTLRVDAPFVIEAPLRRVVPAPFDGFLATVGVKPGDEVVAGETVLAELETTELRLELARQNAAYIRHLKEADIARRERDEALVQVSRAKADAAAAEIDWLERRVELARIVSPIDGVVLRGELDEMLGSPVARGDMLFELSPLADLEAELRVPDNRIDEIRVGQRGQLASASHPGDHVGFEVRYIHPTAEVLDGTNVFRIRVTLDRQPPWMAPGVEGVAKSDVGKRPLIQIWTREAVHWFRMLFWI